MGVWQSNAGFEFVSVVGMFLAGFRKPKQFTVECSADDEGKAIKENIEGGSRYIATIRCPENKVLIIFEGRNYA